MRIQVGSNSASSHVGSNTHFLECCSIFFIHIPNMHRAVAGGPAGPAAAGPIFGQKKKKKKKKVRAHPCEQLRMSIHDDDDVCNK